MAKVALVLHIPDVKADELRRIVHDVDALDTGCEEDAIDTQYVEAHDVLALILDGQYNPKYNVLFSKIEDCMSSGPCGGV